MVVQQIKELIENGGMFWAASSFLYSYLAKGQSGHDLRRNATIGMGAIALFKIWKIAHAHLFTTIVIPQDLAESSDLYRYARELLQHSGRGDSSLCLAENAGAGQPMRMIPSDAFQSTSFEVKPWRKSDSQMFVWRGPVSARTSLTHDLGEAMLSRQEYASASIACKASCLLRTTVAMRFSFDIGPFMPRSWAQCARSEEIQVSLKGQCITPGTFLRVGQEIMQVWSVKEETQTLSVFRAQQNSKAAHHEKDSTVFCLAGSSWVESLVKPLFGSFGPGKLLWISEDTASLPKGKESTNTTRKYPQKMPPELYGLDPFLHGRNQTANEQGLVVTLLGQDLRWLQEMLAEGKQVYDKNAEGHVVTLYRPEVSKKMYDPFMHPGQRGAPPEMWVDKRIPGRPLASVVLPRVQGQVELRGTEEELRDDVARFFSKEEEKFYRARGMPHRRGYLLHGVPGSGKTSVIKAIACDLNLPIFQMSLNMEGMTDSVFLKLMDKVPARSIILFEDIDAAKTSVDRKTLGGDTQGTQVKSASKRGGGLNVSDFANNPDDSGLAPSSLQNSRSGVGANSEKQEPRVNLDTLLNALDGLNAQENRVVFMTTNHKERLDAALIRPGRIDKQVEFCYVTPEQAARYFVRFYSHLLAEGSVPAADAPPCLLEAAAQFGKHVEGLSHFGVPIGLSVCELQQFLLEHRESFSEAVAASAAQLRQTLLAKYFKLRFKSSQEKQQEVVRSMEHNATVFARSVCPKSEEHMLQAVRFLDKCKTQAEALAQLKELLDTAPALKPHLAVSC